MAQSVKLKDGSYIDASAVYDFVQKDTVENLLSNVKDCSSEIASKYNSTITNLAIHGIGKLRILHFSCSPNGTIATNAWIENFITLKKGAIFFAPAIFNPCNGENASKAASGALIGTGLTIHLGGQSYASGSGNGFRAAVVYMVE